MDGQFDYRKWAGGQDIEAELGHERTSEAVRARLEADMAAFKTAGGVVEVIPFGVGKGFDEAVARKHPNGKVNINLRPELDERMDLGQVEGAAA